MNQVIRNNDTSFNQLHKKCLNRIKYIKYCPHCKEYLTFTKEELNKLKPENEQEIAIEAFLDIKEIDPIYYEKSYLLDTVKKSKAYYLFLEALRKSKKVALAKTVLGNKFYYCILRACDYGIIMTTLFFEEEIILPDVISNSKVNEKELNLALRLIDERKGKFEPKKYQDEYQNNIKQAINDKLKGNKIKEVKKKNQAQVNDLLKALEKSLKKKK